MVDKLVPVTPITSATQHHQERYRNDAKAPPHKPVAGRDHVSVEQGDEVGTYGKLAGVEIGSPYQLLRQLVVKTLEEQGVTSRISTGDSEIDLGTLTPEAARELISEDGYFGVEKTSQRIVDFALNAFGNDPARLTQIKDAIDKGFKDAAEAFGGTLPEISHQTYTAVMDKLEAFAGGGNGGEGEDHG